MRVIALICARGGSKGIPNKNIQLLGGKPLLTRAVECARAVPAIERVVLSTDSAEIAAIGEAAGAEVPFLRPAELAQDNSPEWLVWRHALQYLDAHGGMPDVLVVVPTTAPLRTPDDLQHCLDVFAASECDVVITVTEARRSPYFNMVRIREDGFCEVVIPPRAAVSRRQDVPAVFDVTTVAYVTRPEFVLSKAGIFHGRVRAVTIPADRAVDIDTPLDFDFATWLEGRRAQRMPDPIERVREQ